MFNIKKALEHLLVQYCIYKHTHKVINIMYELKVQQDSDARRLIET